MLASFSFALWVIVTQTLAKMGLSEIEEAVWSFNVVWSNVTLVPDMMRTAVIPNDGRPDTDTGDAMADAMRDLGSGMSRSSRTIDVPVKLCYELLAWAGVHASIVVLFLIHGSRPWSCLSARRRKREQAEEDACRKAAREQNACLKAAKQEEGARREELGAQASRRQEGHAPAVVPKVSPARAEHYRSDGRINGGFASQGFSPNGGLLSEGFSRSDTSMTLPLAAEISVADPSSAPKEPRQATRLRPIANGVARPIANGVARPAAAQPHATPVRRSPPRWVSDPGGYTTRALPPTRSAARQQKPQLATARADASEQTVFRM